MNRRPPRNGVKETQINTLLIDGNALFKFGFFGAKSEYNHKGEHIGGLYQFLTILRKLLIEEMYHYVYIFWDGKFSGKLRFDLYPKYKSGRGKDYINGTHTIEVDEVRQKNLIWDYIEELSIRQLQHDFVEADDFIGYYCNNMEEFEKVTICTTDRDMSQLIDDDVKIYFCDLKTYVNKDNYTTFFKHKQENSALIKIITGDNSDSIKGVKGIKEKTLLLLFPEINERLILLSEIIDKSILLQNNRIEAKKKPLKSLHNLINGITDGVQGDRLYEINKAIIDLKNPLMTQDAIEMFNELKNGEFEYDNRTIKNVFIKMKNDGLDKMMSEDRYANYLLPFKQLIEREIKLKKTL